jgi:arylsulfatase A-like enzyme
MQTSVPELTDMRDEPASTWELYGPEAREPGTFAYNCLLARRMAERGVRFTQVYQRGWDVHLGAVPAPRRNVPPRSDRACYALVTDLKQRGLLEDTLVIWGGEFGPHGLQPGRPVPGELRPGPSRRAASPPGWRAAASRRA